MGRAARPERSRPAGVSPLRPQVEGVAVPAATAARELTQSTTSVVPDSGPIEASPAMPKYLTLERKDARLRADQLDDLATLVRRLSRQRHQRTERITDNTLIRVAVDVLLQHTDVLAGDDEAELRNSLTTALRKSGPVVP